MHAMIELLRSGVDDVETLTVYNCPLSIARTVADEPGVYGVNILLFDEQEECVLRWRWRCVS